MKPISIAAPACQNSCHRGSWYWQEDNLSLDGHIYLIVIDDIIIESVNLFLDLTYTHIILCYSAEVLRIYIIVVDIYRTIFTLKCTECKQLQHCTNPNYNVNSDF